MKILTQKVVTIVLFLTSLFFTFDGNTSVSKNETCQEIKTNYINAVKQFLEAAKTIKGNHHFDRAHSTFKDAITNVITTIVEEKNYTFPSLITLNGSIQNSRSPSWAQEGAKELDKQTAHAHTRVIQWKEQTKERPTPCRDQWGCLLGQPGTKCAVNVN